jgi:hypothetical protein
LERKIQLFLLNTNDIHYLFINWTGSRPPSLTSAMIPIAVASASSSSRVNGTGGGSSLQGYLQLSTGQGEVQKSFVLVQHDKLCLYSDDPGKQQYLQPYAMYDLTRVQLVEQGAFQRPKSFGIVTADRGLLEFTCPTNSIRSSWIKVISEGIGNNSAAAPPSSGNVLIHPLSQKRASFIRLPGQSPSAQNLGTTRPSSQPNQGILRTPIMHVNLPSSAPSSSQQYPGSGGNLLTSTLQNTYANQAHPFGQTNSQDGANYNHNSTSAYPLRSQSTGHGHQHHQALPVVKKPLGPKPAAAGKDFDYFYCFLDRSHYPP